jgi:hypothetical protein
MSAIPEWVRSALLTFVTTFALAITATDFEWSQSTVIAAVIAAARTVLSGLLPGGSFGSSPSDPYGDE